MSKAELFAKYLEEIGLLATTDLTAILTSFVSSSEDKNVISELANYIQQQNTSSQYDLSTRVYQSWLRDKYIPMLSSELQSALKDASSKGQASEPVTFRQEQDDQQHYRHTTPEILPSSTKTNASSQESFKKERIYIAKENDTAESRPFSDSARGYSHENEHYLPNQHLARFTESSEENDVPQELVKKTIRSNKQALNQSLKRSSSATSGFNRLYEQRLIHQQNRVLRKEMSEILNLKDCSFSPRVNDRKPSSKAAAEHLKQPVFERLARAKTPREELKRFSKDYREMEGVTFAPDLTKSSRSKPQREGSNEQTKTKASERLYQDAQLKQKILQMKKEYLQERELEDCTFAPKLIASPSARSLQQRNFDAVDRLYLDGVRRQEVRKLNEEIKENEISDCTFHPTRLTHDYDLKLKEKYPNQDPETDIFTRLYLSARKRQELEKEFQEEMMMMDSKRISSAEMYKSHEQPAQTERASKLHTVSTFRVDETVRGSPEKKSLTARSFERLYDEGKKRKQKLTELEQKVMKERGITFTPMTKRSHHSFQSSQRKLERQSADKENDYSLKKSQPPDRAEASHTDRQTDPRSKYPQFSGEFERGKQKPVDYHFDEGISEITTKN